MNIIKKNLFLIVAKIMQKQVGKDGRTISAMRPKVRENISEVLSYLGEKLGYRRIQMDDTLIGFTKEEATFILGETDKIANQITINLCEETELAKKIFDFVVENLEYDYSTLNNSAFRAITDGKTMCAGYAQLFLILARKKSLRVEYIIGEAGNDLHIWNKILIKGNWYHVDCTWADKNPETRYYYFMTDDQTMKKSHIW